MKLFGSLNVTAVFRQGSIPAKKTIMKGTSTLTSRDAVKEATILPLYSKLVLT